MRVSMAAFCMQSLQARALKRAHFCILQCLNKTENVLIKSTLLFQPLCLLECLQVSLVTLLRFISVIIPGASLLPGYLGEALCTQGHFERVKPILKILLAF